MAESDYSSTPVKSPAFQFYPKDFLSAESVRLMSMQERGVYITLICLCWTEGTIPADVKLLARLCGMPDSAFRKQWPAIVSCFKPATDQSDRLVHPRLEREREKQSDFRRRQSDSGKKGAERRWQPHSTGMAAPCDGETFSNGTAIQAPMANDSFASALCSLQSSDSSQKKERACARDDDSEPFDSFEVESAPDDPARRAGAFIERYKALHVRLRKGAHYVGRPTFDFQEALQLVGVYDDRRLDKLAYVWLNTDHDFAQNGTRTIAKFRSMASWCEEKLIEFEAQHGPLKVAS